MPARTAFDVRAALTFVVVAHEKSITRGAVRLGMAQPSVSDAIRRLEDQLGFPLFVRAARRIELTPKGQAFLVVAEKLSQANAEAQQFARSLREGLMERVRIGASYSTTNLPERAALIEAFVTQRAQTGLEVVHGLKTELVERLRRADVDFVFLSQPFDVRGLQALRVHQGVGHFLVPAEDPLSAKESMGLRDLAGRKLVAASRENDPAIYDALFLPLAEAGATLVTAPEGVDRMMEQFARLRRLLHLRFGRGQGKRKVLGDMVRLPLRGEPILLEVFLARRPAPLSAGAEAFWKLAEDMAAGRLEV
jgi:DNA-binding transcriptional LysR family regulator